jgi:hypothetical protein
MEPVPRAHKGCFKKSDRANNRGVQNGDTVLTQLQLRTRERVEAGTCPSPRDPIGAVKNNNWEEE